MRITVPEDRPDLSEKIREFQLYAKLHIKARGREERDKNARFYNPDAQLILLVDPSKTVESESDITRIMGIPVHTLEVKDQHVTLAFHTYTTGLKYHHDRVEAPLTDFEHRLDEQLQKFKSLYPQDRVVDDLSP